MQTTKKMQNATKVAQGPGANQAKNTKKAKQVLILDDEDFEDAEIDVSIRAFEYLQSKTNSDQIADLAFHPQFKQVYKRMELLELEISGAKQFIINNGLYKDYVSYTQ